MNKKIKWALAIAIATTALGAGNAYAIGYGKEPNPVTVSKVSTFPAERSFYEHDARILIERLSEEPKRVERLGADLERMDEDLLDFLQLDEQTFRDKMRSGQSLVDIAEDQGKTRQQLTDFLMKQYQSELDRAAEEGFIPQKELGKIQEFFPDLADLMIEFEMGQSEWNWGAGESFGFEAQRRDFNELLGELKLDERSFRDKILDGQSIAEIAEAQGVSRQQLKDLMTKQNNDQLAQAVEDGYLTQRQADRLQDTFEEELDNLIDAQKEERPLRGPVIFKKPSFQPDVTTFRIL